MIPTTGDFVHDMLIELMPKAVLEMEAANATAFDGILQTAWKENGIIGFHFQDDRLSLKERAVLCNIATRVRGVRTL